MDRHISNSGFMLVEMCAVLLCISVLTLFILPYHEWNDMQSYIFADAYLAHQSKAMADAEHVVFEPEDLFVYISFNAKGDVNQAMSLPLNDTHTVVIELGGGRLVWR